MQSSYKVIKSINAVSEGNKEIKADFVAPKEIIIDTKEYASEMESIEKIAAGIIENARRESRNLLSQAYETAKQIEMDAKEQGFNQGYEEGRKIGYNEGYEEGLGQGQREGNEILQNAKFMLFQAKEEYSRFVKEKEVAFRNLILTSVEAILKKEVSDEAALNNLVFHVLSEEKNEKSFIIRCNSVHYSSIQGEIANFKNKLAFRGEIFVIEDNLLEDGTIIIEKDSGKTTLSMDYSLQKLKELLMES